MVNKNSVTANSSGTGTGMTAQWGSGIELNNENTVNANEMKLIRDSTTMHRLWSEDGCEIISFQWLCAETRADRIRRETLRAVQQRQSETAPL